MDIVQDIQVKACGRDWWVPRTLDLLRRVEQAFGAIKPLAERLGRAHCTHDELLGLFSILLRDEKAAPSRAEIEVWLWQSGTLNPAAGIAMPIYTLAMSEDECRELQRVQERAAAERQKDAAAGERGPFAPTAASSGPGSSSLRH